MGEDWWDQVKETTLTPGPVQDFFDVFPLADKQRSDGAEDESDPAQRQS